ncbi:hypothetical protein SAMN04487761_10631 [Lachnospiraceae bacterium C7]|nr:hypothetical protein SAMN04487761_10631 [Lachnospiraceae bacterium C7]
MIYKKIKGKIQELGFSLSVKNYITANILAVALVFLLHLVLKLQWTFTVIMAIIAVIMLPFYVLEYYKSKYEKKRFEDVGLYIDGVLYEFLRTGKIQETLSAVNSSLQPGKMKNVVDMALKHFFETFDDSDVAKDALDIIAKEYDCKQIKNVHKFMLHVESHGGEIEKSIKLLLAGKSMWELRIKEMLAERSRMFKEVVFSAVISLLICGMVLYIPTVNVDISGNFVVQGLSVFVFLLDNLIAKKAQKFLSVDLLKVDEIKDDEYYIKKMKQWHIQKEEKMPRASIITGSIGVLAVVLAVIVKNQWFVGIAILFAIFGFNQHLVGKKLAEKALMREIKRAFPSWLMDLVLLLQTENVQVALMKSKENVPGILKEELDELISKLMMAPEEAKPYHEFLKDFTIPEIQSVMNMLYSLSTGSGGDANQQIEKLIDKNQKMLNQAEKNRFKDLNSGLYLLFLAPVLTAGLKLVVDMAVFMLTFLTATHI